MLVSSLFFPVLPRSSNHFTISDKSKGAVVLMIDGLIHQTYFAKYNKVLQLGLLDGQWTPQEYQPLQMLSRIKVEFSSREDLDNHGWQSLTQTTFPYQHFHLNSSHLWHRWHTIYYVRIKYNFLFFEINWFSKIFRTSPIILFTTLNSVKYRQNSEKILIHILRS